MAQQVKFGTSQLGNPTPSKVNLYVRVFTVVAGVFMGWMSTNNIIGPITQSYIGSILGLLIGIINAVAPFFGINVSEPTVPTEQVTSMDSE